TSLKITLANRNAPKQAVLSGSTAEIDRAVKVFEERKIAGKKLPVAAAFHSELVADAAKPFRKGIDAVDPQPGSVPVYGTTLAAEYPADAKKARDLLANQLANPVDFIGQIRAMAAAGVRTFIEVGPGSVLTRLAEAILADGTVGPPVADADVFALDASSG